MNRSARGARSAGSSPNKGGGEGKGKSLLAGILLGMLLGIAAAGGVAWYVLKKNPASFEGVAHHAVVKAPVEKAAPVVSAPAPAPKTDEDKQHFEFYKVLTDKQDGASAKNREKISASTKDAAPSAVQQLFYVQAGSFPNQDDAEKLKAKLALLGMEANLQTAAIPNKGTYYRVRLGPFKGLDETNKTLAVLKQNGVANPTPVRAQ
jgi:cell division protein FtsN